MRLNNTVQAYNSRVFETLKWKLTVRGTKDFRQLYPICMIDTDFEKTDKQVPGYVDGIYLLDWTAIGRYEKVGVRE